jgi:hypothetical protein
MDTIFRLADLAGRYVFVPLGLLLLAWAAYKYLDTRAWLRRSVEAPGSVIEMVRVRDRETGDVSFAPLVRFQTRDGKSIEFQSSFRSNPPAYTVGQTVTVLYDPDDPNAAAVSGVFSIWGFSIILALVGFVFVMIGIGIMLIARRLSQPAAPV